MLSDINAIGSNWLHLHNVIALSSSTCGKQDNQKRTENIPEFLVDTHNAPVWYQDCFSKNTNLCLSVAHELYKRMRVRNWVVLFDRLLDQVLIAAG